MSIARFETISAAQYKKDFFDWKEPLSHEALMLPRRATKGSAGYDFFSPVDAVLEPGASMAIPTGIRCAIDADWVLLIVPRSSMGIRWNVRLCNGTGVIDSDYYHADNEGHIRIALYNGGKAPFVIRKGDRIGQGLFVPFGLAEEEAVTTERTGGIGSTGA